MSERTAYRTSARLRGRPQLAMDAIENAVDEPARLRGAELLGDLDGLVDHDLGGRLRAPAHLVAGEPQDVAVDGRHPLEVPVLGEPRDDVVDLLLRRLRAAHELVRELARVVVERVPRPELRRLRPGVALPLEVQLVEELERDFTRLAPPCHRRAARTKAAISSAASAASAPR